jgi:hypothetical protein
MKRRDLNNQRRGEGNPIMKKKKRNLRKTRLRRRIRRGLKGRGIGRTSTPNF